MGNVGALASQFLDLGKTWVKYFFNVLELWTYFMTVISIAVTVFGGYYMGLCDTNMVLLSGEPMVEYIEADNTWLLTKINDQVGY